MTNLLKSKKISETPFRKDVLAIFSKYDNAIPLSTVEKELKEYNKEKGQPWVQSFFKSNEYHLIDNEGGGECLFAVIRDAFKAIDKDISILEMRRKLADEVTPEIYEHYKETYDMFANNIQETDTEMKKLNKLNNELRDKLKNSKDRDVQQQIVENAKKWLINIKY